jgi:hypothetical protein
LIWRRLIGVFGALIVIGCNAAPPVASPDPSRAPMATDTAALVATDLPAGLDPGGLDGDRLAYRTGSEAGVLDLASGQMTAFAAAPDGLSFAPTGIAGQYVCGDGIRVGEDGTLGPSRALAYDLETRTYVDIGAALASTDDSHTFGTDGFSVVGVASDDPTGAGGSRPFVYDLAAGTMSFLASLPAGRTPQPLDVAGRLVVGNDGTGRVAGGFVHDLATGHSTMLEEAAGTTRVEALATDGSRVTGGFVPGGAPATHPFVYDVATGTFTDLWIAGGEASGISGHRVLVRNSDQGTGWLYDLDTNTAVSLAAVSDSASPTGTSAVYPILLSERWLVGTVSTSDPAGGPPQRRVVVIQLGK